MVKEHVIDRIYGEYQAYKAQMLGTSNTEIFSKCYEIDSIVTLYEILVEKVQELPDSTLTILLQHKNILQELYQSWLAKDDSTYRELAEHVQDEIDAIMDKENVAERTAA